MRLNGAIAAFGLAIKALWARVWLRRKVGAAPTFELPPERCEKEV